MKIKTGIILILILAASITGRVSAMEQADFTGVRTTICRISQSDLDNYVSGGRTSLEMLLSRNQQEWLSYGITSQERELLISLSFSFESYEDYEEKISILMKAVPVTTYGKEGQAYIENFSPEELFEFLNYSMKEYEMVDETDFIDFLEVHSDNIELNGETYSGTDIRPQANAREIFFDSIDVDTEKDENGSWTRTIQMGVSDEQSDTIFSELEQRCEQCGVSFESGRRTGTMSFSAQSETELIEKTMTVLQTTVNIRHFRYYQENGTVRNETKENIDVEPLLEKEGEFSYRLELPETYEDLSAAFQTPAADVSDGTTEDEDTEKTRVYENVISYSGKAGKVKYYFNEEMMFDRIVVQTDLSDEMAAIVRTATFVVSGSIEEGCHEKIKDGLTQKFRDGYSMRIYEENGDQYYEVQFQSWFMRDIRDFTESILGVENDSLQIDRKVFPFSESRIEETFSLPQREVKTYSGDIEMIYILPSQAYSEEIYENSQSIKTVLGGTETEYRGDYTFRCFHYMKLLLNIVIILSVITVILTVVCAVRYRIRNGKQGKKQKVQQIQRESRKRICPCCGNAGRTDAKYCGRCGYKFR